MLMALNLLEPPEPGSARPGLSFSLLVPPFFLDSDNLDLFCSPVLGVVAVPMVIFRGLLRDSLFAYSAFQHLYYNLWFS